ncbi:MAG: FMN-binding negative transcriptional regulator [Pseudomonadota bacterium]
MHPNPIFRREADARHRAFARERGFGQLTICDVKGPLAAHVPVLFDDEGAFAEMHLMRSNPVARALATPQAALLSMTGPDGYVSPDWYGVADQVPTWNYVAVHVRGTLERRPDTELRGVLDRLSHAMETRLPKVPWHSGKMSPGVMERMMRSLVPCRFRIETIDGTWKLSQNKTAPARDGAADGVASGTAPGQEQATLAHWMRSIETDA